MRNPMVRLKNKSKNTWRNANKKFLRRIVLGKSPGSRAGWFSGPLNETQELFIGWNAERLGISEQESRSRYLHSWNVVAGGHRGIRFELFMYLSQEIYSVFHGNQPEELFETYAFHGHRDLLRMMIFEAPEWTGEHPLIQGLEGLDQVSILDFGCGLAHTSRSLTVFLKSCGRQVHLHLADIPTIEEPFLRWIAVRTKMPTTFLACTKEAPMPQLPECQVIIATEFFEHVDDPIAYFHRMDEKLQTGGFLITGVKDHEEGFLHLTPNLGPLREELKRRGYRELQKNVLFRKETVD